MNSTPPEIAEMVRARLMERTGAERFRMGVEMLKPRGAWCWARCPPTCRKPSANAVCSNGFTACHSRLPGRPCRYPLLTPD